MIETFDTCIQVNIVGDCKALAIGFFERHGWAFTLSQGTGYCPPWPSEESCILIHWFNQYDLQGKLSDVKQYHKESSQDATFVAVYSPDGIASGYSDTQDFDRLVNYIMSKCDRGTVLANYFCDKDKENDTRKVE